MGNYKFRLADMIPNAWFYKLRDNMKKNPRNQNSNPQTLNTQKSTKKKKKSSSTFHNSSPSPSPSPSPSSSPSTTTTTTTTTVSFNNNINYKPKHSPRKSYYFTRDLIPTEHSPKYSAQMVSEDSPRRSSSSSSKRSPRRRRGPHIKQPDSTVVDNSFTKIELPPIITKPPPKPPKKKDNTTSQGIRLRVNHSPRIVNKKVSGLKKSAGATSAASSRRSRSGLSESLAVVKSSSDPQRDFRESMMEMIVENNIRASKDLEDLLACYLSLNSDEYHAIIIKAFKQIWFDLTHIRNINRIN